MAQIAILELNHDNGKSNRGVISDFFGEPKVKAKAETKASHKFKAGANAIFAAGKRGFGLRGIRLPQLHSDRRSWTVTAATPITCWDPTPNFNCGCHLLLAYDAAPVDGTISHAEAVTASNDYFDGKITKEEAQFVLDCFNNGGNINAMCPDCYLTCTGATPHYANGCQLLLHYDINNDGEISMAEVQSNAIADYNAGLITFGELYFVLRAWAVGSINALCPGCYTAPCTCTAWVNAECTAVGKRRQTRTCTPAGCTPPDGEGYERIIDDASCVVTSTFSVISLLSGPFTPNTDVIIANNQEKNTGNVYGAINVAVAELNADGSIKDEFCRDSGAVDVNDFTALIANQRTRGCDVYTGSEAETVTINKPAGTYYYGIKTWGASEAEPSYPSPTAALKGGKMPVAFGPSSGSETPPLEDVFACLTPRITDKNPMPRIACLIGGNSEEGATETPIKIECLWPRIACMMSMHEEEGDVRLRGMFKMQSIPKKTRYLNFTPSKQAKFMDALNVNHPPTS